MEDVTAPAWVCHWPLDRASGCEGQGSSLRAQMCWWGWKPWSSWPEPGQSLLALVLHIAGGHIHSTAGHIVSVASGKTQPHCVCAGWGCRRARGWPSPQVASVVDSFRKRTRPALSRSLQLQDVVHVVPAHRRSILPQLLEAGQLSIDYQVSRRLPLKSSRFCQTGSRDAYAYGSPERTNYLGTSRVAFRG